MEHIERRIFIKATAALSASALIQPVSLFSSESDEKRKAELAKYHFNFCSPYITSHHETTPHAHLEMKRFIESYTKHEVYVRVHDGGSQGVGSSLANSVKFNKCQGALLSLSNLAPMVDTVDLINIPYWSATNDEFQRVVNSALWKKLVFKRAGQYNLHILFHYLVGSRTATSTKRFNRTIKSPADFKGLAFRVPGSKNLTKFYRFAGASPTPIAWGLCARTAQKGRFQALDPSVIGLYSGPEELNKELGVISKIDSVNDGWVAICSTAFMDSMNAQTRKRFLSAFEAVKEEQARSYQQCSIRCEEGFKKLGTRFYTPTAREKQALSDAFGPEQSIWEPEIRRLLGDDGMKTFDTLREIAKG